MAREYLLRLAIDNPLQAEFYRYHNEIIRPATVSAQKKFIHAFGDNLLLVKLNIPAVIGYEYRDSPDLLYPHITYTRFIEQI